MNPDHHHYQRKPGRGIRGFLAAMIRRRIRLATVIVIPLVAIALAAALVPRAASDASTAGTSAAAPGSHWYPGSILQVMEQGTGQAVIAHRGIFGPGCPENSVCSINQAYQNGMEAIELDVRESASGRLWLSHDDNLGRQVAHTPSFNIFQNANPPDGWDPLIANTPDSQLGDSALLDTNLNPTSYQMLTLEGAFGLINTQGWDHMVIVLDLRTLSAVSTAAKLVIQYGLQQTVVLKFSSSLLANSLIAYQHLMSFTHEISFVPTVYAPDLANIMQAGYTFPACNGLGTLANAQCIVTTWIRGLQSYPGYAWLEVGNKSAVASDPTDFLLNAGLGAIGGFQPVPVYPDKTGPGQSYTRSNGTCCSALTDYLTPANQWFPAETQDGRESISNLLGSGMTSVITDNPQAAIQAMTSRNTGLYGTTTPLQAHITGTWDGTYTCNYVDTPLALHLLANTDGSIRAVFAFGPNSDHPSVPVGSYRMTGSWSSNGMVLTTGSWIYQPPNYIAVGLEVDPFTGDGSHMTGQVAYAGCSHFSLYKINN